MAGARQAPNRVIAVKVKAVKNSPHPKYQLGKEVKEPKVFAPIVQWSDKNYIYRIDQKRLLCKRVPIQWHGAKPAYFTLAPHAVTSQDRIRHSWRRRPMLSLASTSAMAAFCLLIYPYYPEVQYGVQQSLPQRENIQAENAPISIQNQLAIPKIGVTAAILESSSLDILDREQGVWHQLGDINGNFVLAGHRFKYLPPNTTTFYNLNKLEPGDTAVIDYAGKRHVYVVREVKTVKESEVGVLNKTPTSQLTLYTCSDKRETERIVVHADILP